MVLLHAGFVCCVMHADITSLTTQRSASPVEITAAPKPVIVPKPRIAVKPKDVTTSSESVVKCDTAVRQADVG